MAYLPEDSEGILQDAFTTKAITLEDNEFVTGQVERTDLGATSTWSIRVESSTDRNRSPNPVGVGPWTEVPLKFNVILNADKVIAFFVSHVRDVRIGVGRASGSDSVAATVFWRIGKLFPNPN